MLSKGNRNKRHVYKRNPPKENTSRGNTERVQFRGCTRKKKFRTQEEASQAAASLADRIALPASPISAYYCNKHGAWHIGHERRSTNG